MTKIQIESGQSWDSPKKMRLLLIIWAALLAVMLGALAFLPYLSARHQSSLHSNPPISSYPHSR